MTKEDIRFVYILKYKQKWEIVVHFAYGVVLIHIGKTLEYDKVKLEYTKDEILSYEAKDLEVILKTVDGIITLKEMYKTKSAKGYIDPCYQQENKPPDLSKMGVQIIKI